MDVLYLVWIMGLAGLAYLVIFMRLFAMIGRIKERLIYCRDSHYNRVLVYEEGFIRTLRLGYNSRDRKQSVIDVRDLNTHQLEYTQLAFAGLLLNRAPAKVLVIGLGGGVIPRDMHDYFPEAEIDVVEIDPEIVKVAELFFFFKPDERLRVYVADGREFVQQQASREPRPAYDMVVVANVLRSNRLFDAELRTFEAVYGRYYVFLGRHVSNAILLSPGPDTPDLEYITALETADLLQQKHGFTFDLNAVTRQFKPQFRTSRKAKILTDDCV
ncbi:MAG: hypothetical protein JRJ06_03805 [Deltaproteobacteria bacterium]|nr:hypothetical protein [Deltaproteobacteria bacterium]